MEKNVTCDSMTRNEKGWEVQFNYDTYVFDLDGTLLSTLGDLAASCNHALRANGMPERTIDEVRRFVGNGVKKLMERAIPGGLDNPLFEKTFADFRQHYMHHNLDTTCPYPGVMEMLDYRMDTFLTLCEQMNYRKTADLLHISQPAVTQQIHHLETQYGQKLFQYENRRLVKTEAAVILERYARAAKLQEQDLVQKLENSPIRTLRVGATKTIGDYYLKAHIRRYLQSPDHALTLIVDNTKHLLRLLEENELDFAVVESFFDKTRFDSFLLHREPFVGICRRDHPFAGRR